MTARRPPTRPARRRSSAASRRSADGDAAGLLSIGALSRATAIPVETIRTWELRYGFPRPERKPSGHRVYPAADVGRLRRIAEALRRGHRAGEVVGASDKAVAALLEATIPPPGGARPAQAAGVVGAVAQTAETDLQDMMASVLDVDPDRLTRMLLGAWRRLDPVEFLETRVAPLLEAVGDEWAAGRLSVAHEHLLSSRVGDLLRALRLPFEERAAGPLVVLATLSGERHALGLEMAAMVVSAAGCRLLMLGADTPADEAARFASRAQARALAVSVSTATAGAQTQAELETIGRLLPRRCELLVGGAGAPESVPGVTRVTTLIELDQWVRRMVEDDREARWLATDRW